jgi:hypothetical protein
MQFSIFISFICTLAFALAEISQQVITETPYMSNVEPNAIETVVPFILLVPAILRPLPGNVSVSIDNTGALKIGLILDRGGDPFTFTRRVNLTRKHQISSTVVDNTYTTYIIHLDGPAAGKPITVPIAIPIPGANETGIGNTIISFDADNNLGVDTSIQAGNRNVSFSDNISVGLPPQKVTSSSDAQCAARVLQGDECWKGGCPPGCCDLELGECVTDQDCLKKPGAYPTCECQYRASEGRICSCITVSIETVSSFTHYYR